MSYPSFGCNVGALGSALMAMILNPWRLNAE